MATSSNALGCYPVGQGAWASDLKPFREDLDQYAGADHGVVAVCDGVYERFSQNSLRDQG